MKIDNSFWLFLALFAVSWWAITEYESNSLLKDDNFKKSKIIATQSLQFNRFNQIATSAYRYGIQAEVKSQERVIEYRTILKKEPTCDLLVPQSIANRLLKYTDNLRSMYTDTGNINSASISTSTSQTLTYCEAVVWVDYLLAALDKANGQLKSIRDIDAERNNPTPH
ncbi:MULTISPECIES: hypothetical protein [Providencia]|uniref:hypothetical protein n=1 Tax=Providencia TaxID=586 RepID=UPI00065E77DB|nr:MULTISPECIES: hypothetical protein [Providencia]